MIKIKVFITAVSIGFFSFLSIAQQPVWQGKGRIAISSDGNEHDHDDWAATPLSLSLLAAKGLQNKLVLYTYSDHIWGSNHDWPTSKSGLNAYEQMKESALGGKEHFGFDNSQFICAVDNPKKAYKAMAKVINASTEDNPLIIIAAGPMQVVGEGINLSKLSKRKYVTVISHSSWNNKHANKPNIKFEKHSGWTFSEMINAFENDAGGAVKFIQILDQNGNGFEDKGFNCNKQQFDWIKTSEEKNNKLYKKGAWDWLYSRLETCVKNKNTNFDPSDAGMVVYLLTGVEDATPALAKDILEHPQAKQP